MPPYVITPAEIDALVATARDGIVAGDMRLTRVFVPAPLQPDADLLLPAAAAVHVGRVLRLREGADDRSPSTAAAATTAARSCAVTGDEVRVRVGAHGRTAGVAAAHHAGAGGLARRAHGLDAAEGHRARRRTIVPVLSARSVVRLDDKQAESKLRHWQAIVASACEQCGRSIVPEMPPAAGLRPLPGVGDPRRATLRARVRPDRPRSPAWPASARASNC